jgi:hypothetical protein
VDVNGLGHVHKGGELRIREGHDEGGLPGALHGEIREGLQGFRSLGRMGAAGHGNERRMGAAGHGNERRMGAAGHGNERRMGAAGAAVKKQKQKKKTFCFIYE